MRGGARAPEHCGPQQRQDRAAFAVSHICITETEVKGYSANGKAGIQTSSGFGVCAFYSRLFTGSGFTCWLGCLLSNSSLTAET